LDFFAEYLAEKAEYADRAEKYTSKLKELSDRLANPEDDLIAEFINDQGFRRELIQELADSPISLVAGFITIFEKALDETWERARPKNAFEAYAENLSVVLDILTGFEVEQIPPALFQAAAYALERVAWYVGKDLGESYAAADLWDERKGELTADMVGELRAVAEQYSYVSLRGRLLATLNDE
jgi:hypothetical protein